MSMIFTVEYDPDGEVKIFCDTDGAKSLINFLSRLVDGKETHYHLMTPSWGGNELTEDQFGKNTTVINQVLLNIVK
jgi:hypothetical protein